MNKAKRWFWGIYLVLAAAAVIASQTVGFVHVGFWTVLVTALVVALFLNCLLKRFFPGVTFSLALLYWLYQAPLGLYVVNGWALFAASLLGGIGLSLIFGHRPRKNHHASSGCAPAHGRGAPEMQLQAGEDDNHPCASVRFGAASRYLHSTALERGEFCASFGALEVFFDEVTLLGGHAEILVDCSLGGIALYVPRSWRVQDNVSAFLGGVDNDTRAAAPQSGDAPTLTLTGSVRLGGIEVKYV